MSYVRVQNVVKSFGERTVLAGVSLEAERGATVAVLGPSGSGKSTLLNILGALIRPDEGEVVVGDVNVTDLAAHGLAQYRSRCVGFVFQEHHLLPQLTILENVLLPTLAAGTRADQDRAVALLGRVGIQHRMNAYPWQVSGGERQRAALARALMNEPGLLLCDEPTGNLDHATGAEVMDLLLDLASDRASNEAPLTVIMVTHNLDHAARLSRRYKLEGGVLKEAT